MDAPSAPAPLRVARLTLAAWDVAQPRLLGFALRVVLTAACLAAAPFFLLALALLPFDVPLWWSLVPAGVGGALLVAGGAAYWFLRVRLLSLRSFVASAEALEQAAFGVP